MPDRLSAALPMLVGGVFDIPEFLIGRKVQRKAARAQAAAADLARELLPDIRQRAEESIFQRGIPDSTIAETIRRRAALAEEAKRKQLEFQAAQVRAASKLRKLGLLRGIGQIAAGVIAAGT